MASRCQEVSDETMAPGAGLPRQALLVWDLLADWSAIVGLDLDRMKSEGVSVRTSCVRAVLRELPGPRHSVFTTPGHLERSYIGFGENPPSSAFPKGADVPIGLYRRPNFPLL